MPVARRRCAEKGFAPVAHRRVRVRRRRRSLTRQCVETDDDLRLGEKFVDILGQRRQHGSVDRWELVCGGEGLVDEHREVAAGARPSGAAGITSVAQFVQPRGSHDRGVDVHCRGGAELARRTAVGALELDGSLTGRREVPAPGGARGDAGGQGRVDDVDAVGAFTHPQRDADVEVGAHVGADGAAGALRREDDVHAERPSHGRQTHQTGDEIGQFVCQHAEFVDDDEEPRQR